MNFLRRASSRSQLFSTLTHHLRSTTPPFRRPPPRRTYYPPPRQDLIHFSRSRTNGSNQFRPRWYHDPRKVTAVVVITGAGAVAVYFGHLETVPYTNRRHLVLIPPSLERQLGERQFAELKATLRDKILPPLHPDSVRVRLISAEIVHAVKRGLGDRNHQSHVTEYSDTGRGNVGVKDEGDMIVLLHGPRDVKAVGVVGDEEDDGKWGSDEKLLEDDEWVRESRRKGKERRSQPETKHLEGLKWEVIVVKDKLVNAMCLPGGKIVVFTGLLDHFRTDPEIASVIGHEVAHAIARHPAEMITKNLWFTVLQIVALQFIYMPDLIYAMSNLLLRLPFSRKMEIEADHIGLLLLAAAGYDPRVAPTVYEKLGKIAGDSALNNYLSTHPSAKKRAELLRQAQVMQEALEIYRQSIAGRAHEGFL